MMRSSWRLWWFKALSLAKRWRKKSIRSKLTTMPSSYDGENVWRAYLNCIFNDVIVPLSTLFRFCVGFVKMLAILSRASYFISWWGNFWASLTCIVCIAIERFSFVLINSLARFIISADVVARTDEALDRTFSSIRDEAGAIRCSAIRFQDELVLQFRQLLH